ncbi:MAG: hypothetical protein K2J24_02795 [Muribaculaceae bacterium]|nr:hypothetical protein [Muribaculaceae bacterium]
MNTFKNSSLLYKTWREIFMSIIVCVVSYAYADVRLDSTLKVLIDEINASSTYSLTKEQRLNSLRKAYFENNSAASSFRLAKELFDEYIYYQSDSAYSYASRMREHAQKLNEEPKLALANFALMKCFSSNGYFKEAADMNRLIDVSQLPHEVLTDYLRSSATFYQNLESYVGGADTQLGSIYRNKRLEVARQLASVADTNSYLWQQNNIDLMENPSPKEQITERLKLLQCFRLDDHEQAIQHSLLGHAYLADGNRNAAKFHLAQSAIHDLRGNIHETTAAKMLAELMYEDNDLHRAHLLVHRAFDDASFYNSHLRRDQLSRTMQLIDSARFNWRSNQLWMLVAVVIGFLFLSGAILVLFIKVRHRNRLIEAVNKEIQEKSDSLARTQLEVETINQELQNTISQLKEVSEIKDRYITQSLYVNTVFVNQVEERCKNAMKQLKEKKYDELKFLPFQMGIKEERQRIFRSFDNAFLQLFPNFIEEFNCLFKEEDWIELNENQELPMDIRIFALLRLGISDPTEVAKYLNLSPKTVYVYKTKLKSKSLVENNDFEARIMAIPKP